MRVGRYYHPMFGSREARAAWLNFIPHPVRFGAGIYWGSLFLDVALSCVTAIPKVSFPTIYFLFLLKINLPVCLVEFPLSLSCKMFSLFIPATFVSEISFHELWSAVVVPAGAVILTEFSVVYSLLTLTEHLLVRSTLRVNRIRFHKLLSAVVAPAGAEIWV